MHAEPRLIMVKQVMSGKWKRYICPDAKTPEYKVDAAVDGPDYYGYCGVSGVLA